MNTEIIITVVSASRSTGEYTPAEIAYFTTVQDYVYGLDLPDGWEEIGTTPTGMARRKAVTVSLPDFIHDVPGGIRSDYTSTDGNKDLVFAKVPAVRVTGSIEQAIDDAIQSLTITAPTISGKREEIPFEILSVTAIFGNRQPDKCPLLAIRTNKGMTQAKLAELSGINARQIRKIETGEIKTKNITIGTITALAHALGVEIEDLIGE